MIAVIDCSNKMKAYVKDAVKFSIDDLAVQNLQNYSHIFINGNHEGIPVKLSYEVIKKLWKFVEDGGVLYAEMLDCEDFPSSRLFGFKQDFPVTNRRLEKLIVTEDSPFCKKGQLLEWQGPFLTGFTFETECLLEIGHFKETHYSQLEGSYPGLISRKIGQGRTIFSTISLLGNPKPWTLRPNWLWNSVFKVLINKFELPLNQFEPQILLTNENISEKIIDKGVKWFLQSGIMPKEDGSLGVYENIHSIRSEISKDYRPDCNAHTALMFHLYGEYKNDEYWKDISKNILNYLFDNHYQDLEQQSATFGFWKWFNYPKEKPDQMFTDDNSWVAFILLYLYRKTGIEEYKKRGLLTAYSLLNTQNKNGLRPEVLRERDLLEKGVEYFQNSTESSMNPHFESICHAAFIQAYLVSNDQEFLNVAKKGTYYLLENKDKLKFMYSKTAGYSRFLFSIAQLYALTKDVIFRDGLDEVIGYLQKHQHELGGIEESDNPDPERYGTEDTGVFRHNGEGIADQLYTNNFLAMNALEAWKATKDEKIKSFYEKIIQFISNIQINSPLKEFDGGWMRSFHFESKEYFGNNGDTGWGAYVIESGWTNAIILSGLILKEINCSLLD